MFLKPTAKPLPRLMPWPRVVFPAPPGRRIGSRGSSSGGGGSSAAARLITSATGSEPLMICPVGKDAHPHADEPAFSGRTVLGPDLRRVAMDMADERLLPSVDELDGTVGVEREQRAVDLHRQVFAAAERAADTGEVYAHLLRLEPEARGHLVAVD